MAKFERIRALTFPGMSATRYQNFHASLLKAEAEAAKPKSKPAQVSGAFRRAATAVMPRWDHQ